jgi:hypothetical protein
MQVALVSGIKNLPVGEGGAIVSNNDLLYKEQAVWIPQNMLLAGRKDMNELFQAIEKNQKNAEKIKAIN